MRRRTLLALLAASAAWPSRVLAQSGTARIGFLWLGTSEVATLRKALVGRLRELGYEEGRNLRIEERTPPEGYDKLAEAARELVRLRVDLIVTFGNTSARAAREATATIPVVMMVGADPVKGGLVASMARPGGNVTGLTFANDELNTKQMELLRETLPGARRVGALFTPRSTGGAAYLRDADAAGKRLGLQVLPLEVTTAKDLEPSFAAAVKARADAMLVVPASLLLGLRQRIGQLSLSHRLPCFGYSKEFSEAGALVSYGVDREQTFRRAAGYAARILKGASPTELPVEGPSEFELVVNAGAAKALGVAIPQAILLRATRVID